MTPRPAAQPVAAPPPEPASAPRLRIRADRSAWERIDLPLAWRQRELAFFLALRDLKLRYKQTALGVLWTVLQPVLTTGVLTLFVGKLVSVKTGRVPYPLFCFSGLLAWNFFANAVGRGATALVANGNLLSKIYFPRILIPLSALVPPVADLGFGLLLLFPAALWFGFVPGPALLWALPCAFALLAALVTGLSLMLGTLNVRYRDVTNVLPFLLQLGMFATPIIYPADVVSGRAAALFAMNPMVGIISLFRHAALGVALDPTAVALSAAASGALFAAGLLLFARFQGGFADDL